MINPFQESSRLINITTGQLATSDKVLQAKERGLRALSKAEKENDFKVQPVNLQLFEKIVQRNPLPQERIKGPFIWKTVQFHGDCALL